MGVLMFVLMPRVVAESRTSRTRGEGARNEDFGPFIDLRALQFKRRAPYISHSIFAFPL